VPNVSIIVPVYNVEQYLEKCLNSLVNQTLIDIEIIIVNDGSEDNSEEIIKNYKDKYDTKIIYIKKENGGLSDARNTGIRYASGEYIGCVDGDDYVELTMYEKMYNAARQKNVDLIECDILFEYPHKKKHKTSGIYTLENMLTRARWNAWHRIIRREIIQKSNIQYPVGLRYEDVEYFCKLAPYITSIEFVKEPLYHYIQRDNSITHNQNEKTRDIFKILNNVLSYYQDNGIYDKYKQQLEYVFIKILLGGSFFRIVRIDNKQLRRMVLEENWSLLNNVFPNWKKNRVLQKNTSLKDNFFKTMNGFTYKVYSVIFHFFNMNSGLF
jgi:glycosyltransferase involved in cell wall biosynthesis